MDASVNDVTRAAFLSGYPAENWLAVVQQLKPHPSPTLPASEICAAVFSLLEAYPLSPVLLQYLCVALDSPSATLPIGIYLSALVAWSSILTNPSPALTQDQTTQTLSALCAIAAPRVQNASGLAPTLPTAQGCLSLVQHVHMHHAHDTVLTSATLDILSAVLGTVTATPPNPNLSPALALHLVPALDTFLQGPVSENVSRPLTAWLFQLSALTTEGARAHVPLSVDEPPGRPELLDFAGRNGPLFDLLAYQLTSVLAHKDDHMTALHTVFNATHPELFATQLYVSLLSVLAAERDAHTRLIIRATLFGSLPPLLAQLEATAGPKLREALHSAISSLSAHYSALFDKCDAQSPPVSRGEDAMEEDSDEIKGKNVRAMLVQSLQNVSLLDANFSSGAAPGSGRLFVEARENGLELEAYLKSRLLSSDVQLSDKTELADRAVADPETHSALCSVLHKGYTSLAVSAPHMSPTTLESLAHLSRLLYTHPTLLHVIGLWIPPVELVAAGLAFLEDLEGAGLGDPQSALGQYGDLRSGTIKHGDRVLDASYLTSAWAVYHLSDLLDAERTLVNDWVKATFDSNSGIDDNILRSTGPRVLLKLCATLFAEAIQKCAAEPEGAGMEILRNGVSYFEEPLLNWTLRGVIWALANEAERHGHAAQTHLDILQLLVLANGCPAPVIEMTRHRVLRLLASPHIPKANIDVNALMGVLHPASSTSSTTPVPLSASSYLNVALQNVSSSEPIPNPVGVLYHAGPLALLTAPVHQGSDPVVHRNVLVALLTLTRPRFAGIKYVLAAIGRLAGVMDSDFLAGVVAGAIGVWLAAPGERAAVRERVKRFVQEGEKEKGVDGIVKRMMGVEFVRACVGE